MKKAAKVSLICVGVFFAVIAILVGVFFLLIEPNISFGKSNDLDLGKLTSYSRTVTLLDKYGNPIDDAAYDKNSIYVRFDELPDYTVNSFIAIEDKRFYKHHGVDYKRVASALLSNIKQGGFNQGASTITQQLIKNTHLSNDKTIERKIKEMRLARKLERIYTKEQILESYFNILYFGSGIRGLGTASRVMFEKPASQLTIAQSAALASIINNPSKYSPYYNIDNLNRRKELVLKEMLNQGYISDSDYKTALTENLEFSKNKQIQFVSAAFKNACELAKCSEKALFINNYSVQTGYDPVIVVAARIALKDVPDDYTARILILDNVSGCIVCDETNMTKFINPKRSPASTVKPFLSYATALENGCTPLTQINDSPATFGDYAPQNYRNVYRGYMSVKDCLINSSNIAAVKLMRQFGVETCKEVGKAFGLSFEQSDNSLALALGGMTQGVTLAEIANAYRTLANGGIYSDVCYVQTVLDGKRAICSVNNKKTRAVGEDTAFLLTDMLRECARKGTAKRLNRLGIIAAKTGTNGDENGNYDCYTIAYTPDYTIAAWLGAQNEPIPNNVTGATCCNLINNVCKNGQIPTDKQFAAPQSVAYYEIDGKELNESHEVYLADPLLPKRYRYKTLLSKRYLPIRKNIDLIDYYDRFMWED